MSQPKPRVWFNAVRIGKIEGPIGLERRTKMLYDQHHLFINGAVCRASGRDAALMRRLADDRVLDWLALTRGRVPARAPLQVWCDPGWVHGD